MSRDHAVQKGKGYVCTSHSKHNCADGIWRNECLFWTKPLLKIGMLACQELEKDFKVQRRGLPVKCCEWAQMGAGLLRELMTWVGVKTRMKDSVFNFYSLETHYPWGGMHN